VRITPEKIAEYRTKMRTDPLMFGYVVCRDIITDKTDCVLHKDIAKTLLEKPRQQAIISPRGHAKAQTLTSLTLTPNGWVQHGSLKVGDYVIGSDGKPTRIVGVSEVMYTDTYRLHTRDNRSVTVSGDHRWVVTCPSNTGNKPITKTTEEILANYKAEHSDKRGYGPYEECRYFIGTVAPIRFSEKQYSIDPYVLGAWLGDGTNSSGGFASNDEEIVDYIREHYPANKNKARYMYSICGLIGHLRELGVLGNKHIPKQYLLGSVEQRELLLQGLNDTDGSVSSDGTQVSFCQKDEGIVDSYIELVRSLGGTATKCEQQTRFDKSSEYKKSYRVISRVPASIRPFRLSRKMAKWKGSIRTKNAITNIEYVGKDYCKCIKVAAEDGIYVTQDYLLTHNTSWASTVGTVFDIAYDTEDVIVLIKKTFPLAVTDLRNIVTQVKYNDMFKLFFGHREFLIDRQEKVYILNPVTGHKTYIEVKGAGQSIRGIVVDGKRPTKILMDDFEDENNTLTPEQRDKVREWIAGQVMPSLNPSKGHIMAIGTIVHYDSWLNNLWESSKKAESEGRDFSWHVIFHQMIENGAAIWPERFTEEYIANLKLSYAELNRMDMFYQEYMNIPFNIDNADFRREYFKKWAGSLGWSSELGNYIKVIDNDSESLYPVDVIIGIDPSSGTSGDYTGIVVMANTPSGKRYIEVADRKMLKPNELKDYVFELHERYHPRLIVMEEQAMQVIMGYWLREEMALRNKYLPIIGEKVSTRQTKEDKLRQALQPIYQAGVMHHKEQHTDLEVELLTFPKGKNDDLMDAVYLASRYSQKPRDRDMASGGLQHRKRRIYDWMVPGRKVN